jgi:hypothetical protein
VGAFGFVDPDPRPFPRCATIVDLENWGLQVSAGAVLKRKSTSTHSPIPSIFLTHCVSVFVCVYHTLSAFACPRVNTYTDSLWAMA